MAKESFEKSYIRKGESRQQQAVIFDLDGTLMDTLKDLTEAVNAALATKELLPCTMEQVRQYVGNGIRNLMQQAVPGGEDYPGFEEIFAFFKEYYNAHCLDNTEPYPNILNLLAELRERQMPVAVVSNKVDSAVKELCDHFFSDYVTVAIGEMEGIRRKPAPDMVEKALEELGVPKENTVYVGDSEVDLETAERAGLRCISVTWGFKSRAFLAEKGAKTLVVRPLELLYLL
ncbi:MAG: HAD family hydrolase [Blautia sp.]|nr:HAD family hydrolase [Blautia sp.]